MGPGTHGPTPGSPAPGLRGYSGGGAAGGAGHEPGGAYSQHQVAKETGWIVFVIKFFDNDYLLLFSHYGLSFSSQPSKSPRLWPRQIQHGGTSASGPHPTGNTSQPRSQNPTAPPSGGHNLNQPLGTQRGQGTNQTHPYQGFPSGYQEPEVGPPASGGGWRTQQLRLTSSAGDKVYSNGSLGSGSNPGSRPQSAERTQPNGGAAYASHVDTRTDHGTHQRTNGGGGIYHTGAEKPPPLPQRNTTRAGSFNKDPGNHVTNGYGGHAQGGSHYSRPSSGGSGSGRFQLANGISYQKRETSESPLRHNDVGSSRNSVEMTTLRGSSQDVARQQQQTSTTNLRSGSSTPQLNHKSLSNQSLLGNHPSNGHSSHRDLTDSMAELNLNKTIKWRDPENAGSQGQLFSGQGHLNSGQGHLNLGQYEGGFVNPNYSPSEASSTHSMTPPLPPLSPSNTPPITPPGSPRGAPPHLRGNPPLQLRGNPSPAALRHQEQPHPHLRTGNGNVQQLSAAPDVITSTGACVCVRVYVCVRV